MIDRVLTLGLNNLDDGSASQKLARKLVRVEFCYNRRRYSPPILGSNRAASQRGFGPRNKLWQPCRSRELQRGDSSGLPNLHHSLSILAQGRDLPRWNRVCSQTQPFIQDIEEALEWCRTSFILKPSWTTQVIS